MILQLFFSSTSKSSLREMRRLPNGKYEVKESYGCEIFVQDLKLLCRFNTTIRRSYLHVDCI